MKSKATAPAPLLAQAPVKAVEPSGEEVEVAEVHDTVMTAETLPTTASPLPLLGCSVCWLWEIQPSQRRCQRRSLITTSVSKRPPHRRFGNADKVRHKRKYHSEF
jgi:hypothetical protein